MRKKLGVLTSGGDTPGMNAAIRSVVLAADDNGFVTMGIKKGYAGLISGDVSRIKPEDVRDIANMGGTILKTARCREFMTDAGRQKALNVIKAYNIEGMVVIGGDGSFAGAEVLDRHGIPTVAVPATIDNDLPYTDFTIGFDTAVNLVISEMAKIRDTMNSHERIGVIEVMGNQCGDIALYAGIAGPAENIVIPEKEKDLDEICDRLVSERIKGKTASLVLVAEGAGSGIETAQYIHDMTGLEAKAIVLGYTQRGGSPSAADRMRASSFGIHAVQLLARGNGGRAVGIRNNNLFDEEIKAALATEPRAQTQLLEEYRILSRNG